MPIEFQPGRVLVADNEPAARKDVARTLKKNGYLCTEVNDAASTLGGIRADRPDIVILDSLIRDRSGASLLPDIASLHPHIAVIMTTPVADTGMIVACLASGAQDYIAKPVEPGEIVTSLGRAVAKKRLEQQIGAYRRQLELTSDGEKDRIRDYFLGAVEALVCSLEAYDRYMAGHSRRVTRFAMAIGREMGMVPSDLEDLWWASLLHDVGRIAIDPAVQNKPGRLTGEEYRQVMAHAMVGAGIIGPLANRSMIDIITHHHDHYDGTGLAQKLNGSDVPLGARVLAVSDSFDAMTSERPFRSAFSIDASIVEVMRCAGSQFDPEVVRAFLKTVGHFSRSDN